MIIRAELTLVFVILFITSVQTQGIDRPPDFSTPRAKQLRYIEVGDDISLVCEADAQPVATYSWKQNGTRLSSSNAQFQPMNGTLYITGFNTQNTGTYQCFAENIVNGNEAIAMSNVITLEEVVLISKWPSEVERVSRNQGLYLGFKCDNHPKCVPPPQFSWSKLSDTSDNDEEGQVKPSDRIYVDNTGTLHFTYLRPEDDTGTQTYKCGIRNIILEVIKLGNNKKLTVTTTDGISPISPINQYRTNPAEFLRTGRAELECVFSGYPIPTITWRDRHNNPITATTNRTKYEIPNSRKLVIKDLEQSDEGDYFCEGQNSMGSNEAKIFLNVTSGPIWTRALSSQTVPEGSDAVFSCKAESLPKENPLHPPTWFRNGEQIEPKGDGKIEWSDNYRVLTVRKVNKQTDIQCFQCQVSNSKGSEFSDGCLNSVDPIVITTQPNLRQVAVKPDIIDLTVLGTTDPRLTLMYWWTFKNATYTTQPPYVTYDASNNRSYIDTSDLSLQQLDDILGVYYRTLSNSYENKTVAIEVISEAAASAGVATVLGAEIGWIIAVCIALLIVLLLILLLICYIRYRSDEGAYKVDSKEKESGLDPEGDLRDGRFKDVATLPAEQTRRKPNLSAMDNPSFRYSNEDLHDVSLNEYGSDAVDFSKFNEDGSFIGQYRAPTVAQNKEGQTNAGFANESYI